MYKHVCEYRIPYPEVDRLNVVHHSHYAKYYEIGRIETMRSLGWNYKDMEDSGMGLFVAEINSKFLRPAKYDEIISIETTMMELPSRRITFKTEILNPEGEVCNTGTVKLLFVNKARMKVCSVPTDLKVLLEPYFNQ